jgi:hypothetical protein
MSRKLGKIHSSTLDTSNMTSKTRIQTGTPDKTSRTNSKADKSLHSSSIQADSIQTLPFKEHREIQLPQRSPLYTLEPIGLGTPIIESMTSFITRLSVAHSFTPLDLLREVIHEKYKDIFHRWNYRPDRVVFSDSILNRPWVFNGMDWVTFYVVKALESIFNKNTFKHMTVLSLRKIVSRRSLFREYAAYCPACFSEWREKDIPLYEPLLWKFNVIRKCPIHAEYLSYRCPKCLTPVPHLTRKRIVGWCHSCGNWLGEISSSEIQETHRENPDAWNDPTCIEVGRVLHALQHEIDSIRRSNIDRVLLKCITYIDSRPRQHSGWSVEYQPRIRSWVDDKYPIELEALLYICHCFCISLLDFLRGQSIDFEAPQFCIPTDLALFKLNASSFRIGRIWSDKHYRGDWPAAFEFFRYATRTVKHPKGWRDLRRHLTDIVEDRELKRARK